MLWRELRDNDFLHSKISAAKQIFTYGILPELIGKYYTHKPVANSDGFKGLFDLVEPALPEGLKLTKMSMVIMLFFLNTIGTL